MSDSNPFQSSSVPGIQAATASEADAALAEVSRLLARTKPWVRFLSVLGILGSICAFGFVLLGSAVGPGGPGPMELIVVIPMCILFYLIPSILLWKYASRIGDFLDSGDPAAFATALTAQKSFWKYLGVFGLIIVIFYCILFGGMGILALLR